jgi:hypothetical protein
MEQGGFSVHQVLTQRELAPDAGAIGHVAYAARPFNTSVVTSKDFWEEKDPGFRVGGYCFSS